jgi:hypothetical protein
MRLMSVDGSEPVGCQVERRDPDAPGNPGFSFDLSVCPRQDLKWSDVREPKDVTINLVSK